MTWDIWPDPRVARELRDRETPMRLVGNTDPVCPGCSHTFPKMPLRKGSCPSCRVEYVSRTCPVRGQKILVLAEDVGAMEAVWAHHFIAQQLSRPSSGSLAAGAAGASLIDGAVGSLGPGIMAPRCLREWSSDIAAWTQIAGACALALRLELAVHALAGRIALDMSGAGSDFGMFSDAKHFERQLATLEGTEPPPFPYDVSNYRQEGFRYFPIVPLPDVGEVNQWSLRMLEALCGFGHVSMDFVRWSIEAHCEAMTRRGALMVPSDQAWTRFVALARR